MLVKVSVRTTDRWVLQRCFFLWLFLSYCLLHWPLDSSHCSSSLKTGFNLDGAYCNTEYDDHIVTIDFWETISSPVLKDYLSQETTFEPCKLIHQGYASASLTFNSVLIHHSTVLLIWNFDYSHTPHPLKSFNWWNSVKLLLVFKCFLCTLNKVLYIIVYINSHHKVCMLLVRSRSRFIG